MNKIKELREERKLTTRELANKIEMSHGSISLYELEKREPSIQVIKKLTDFFEVTIDYLLCYSNYCLYAKYKEGNFFFKINENYYKELKEKKYIYFDNNDHRCIDINSLIGIKSNINAMGLFEEFTRINKAEALFKKGKPTNDEIKALDDEITEIELTRSLVETIKEAIK